MHDLLQARSASGDPAALPGRRSPSASLTRVFALTVFVGVGVGVGVGGCVESEPALETTPRAPAPHDAEGQRRVALAGLVGEPALRDVSQSLLLLRTACAAGSACACLERAAALETFDGRAEALGEAARLYEKLCESTQKTRCTTPVKSPVGSAFEARTSSGAAPTEILACYNWSQLLLRGVCTAPDAADADVLSKRACAGGLVRACTKGP